MSPRPTCPTCTGAGQRRCRHCGGSGRLPGRERKACVVCDGAGKVKCRACNGTGKS